MAMTPEEHTLMLMMFARLSQHIMTLEEILKSRGVVTPDDLPAFDFAVRTDYRASAAALEGTTEQYRKYAEMEGVRLP